ncbi:hypothetical protein KC726_05465 [Candidatus Woesebacteria bacterium]|nr:hypothetical protein [Candidatus Woesebacteria bacterium]
MTLITPDQLRFPSLDSIQQLSVDEYNTFLSDPIVSCGLETSKENVPKERFPYHRGDIHPRIVGFLSLFLYNVAVRQGFLATLNEHDQNKRLLMCAAAWHDCEQGPGHEGRAVATMQQKAAALNGQTSDDLEQIKQLIFATKVDPERSDGVQVVSDHPLASFIQTADLFTTLLVRVEDVKRYIRINIQDYVPYEGHGVQVTHAIIREAEIAQNESFSTEALLRMTGFTKTMIFDKLIKHGFTQPAQQAIEYIMPDWKQRLEANQAAVVQYENELRSTDPQETSTSHLSRT